MVETERAEHTGSAQSTGHRTDDVVLSVEHVAKSFRLPTEQASGLKQAIINWFSGVKGYREQTVLKDINFTVRRGDFFGIVGRNGSGKSTLLKLISQIYKPESGRITVHGRLIPFIELGVGFNPELTGRENVYLNGALLGFSREQIEAMYDDIVEFAELGEFMDQKLKNYSSGMQVRLAFSVAIKAQGDILVLDEVLAVGDEAFQHKCNAFFEQIKKDPTKTVILVTHDMSAIKRYCNKAILIKDGEVVVSGSKTEVADRYSVENLEQRSVAVDKNAEGYATGLSREVPQLNVTTPDLLCPIGNDFSFSVAYNHTVDRPIYLNITLLDRGRGGVVLGGRFNIPAQGERTLQFHVPTGMFTNSDLRVMASLHVPKDPQDPSGDEMIAFTNEENSCDFIVRGRQGADNYGLINAETLQYVSDDEQLVSPRNSVAVE